jgi:hypothetical protein
MNTITALVVIISAAFFIFFGFLVFSKLSFMKLLLGMVPLIVFGFYLNYDIRKMVRDNLDRGLIISGQRKPL